MVRVISAGKLSSYREGAQRSGVQTCLLAEDEGLKQGLSQKMCCLCSLHAHLHRLVSEGPDTRWLSHLLWESEPSQEATSPLVGKVQDVWSPESGLSQKLCCFCIPHAHLHILPLRVLLFVFLREYFHLRLAYSVRQGKCTREGCMPSVYNICGHSSREHGSMQANKVLEK